MSKGYIKISPKHGVNPSMIICPYCREPKGIALMGRLPQDREAPKEVIADYEPCDNCKKLFAGGVLCLDTVEVPTFENQQPVFEDKNIKLYPTFRFMVLNKEFVKDNFNISDDQDTMVMAHQAFDHLYSQIQSFMEPVEN